MPFRSEAQRRFLWAKHPEIARRWAREEKSMKYSRPKKRGKFGPKDSRIVARAIRKDLKGVGPTGNAERRIFGRR